MSKCSFGCGQEAVKEFKNGNKCCSTHSSSCPAQRAKNSSAKIGVNPWEGRNHPRGFLGKVPWNAGKTKHNCAGLLSTSRTVKAFRKANPTVGWTKNDKHTDETLAVIREKAANNGGYREGSGRGCKGRYKGIHCDSSWELAFVLWCEIKGREVKRARKRFKYMFEGKVRTYLPDFRYKTSQGIWKYLEVKGFKTAQWAAKKAAFPYELLFVGKRVITKQILPVVVKVHGKDFIRLYE